MENVIGYTNIYLYRYNVVETNMDAMLADAIREITNTDIALSNGFRFSHPIPPGYITEEDLWNVYPVVEKLKVGKIYGWQLREFWEKELENVFLKILINNLGVGCLDPLVLKLHLMHVQSSEIELILYM